MTKDASLTSSSEFAHRRLPAAAAYRSHADRHRSRRNPQPGEPCWWQPTTHWAATTVRRKGQGPRGVDSGDHFVISRCVYRKRRDRRRGGTNHDRFDSGLLGVTAIFIDITVFVGGLGEVGCQWKHPQTAAAVGNRCAGIDVFVFGVRHADFMEIAGASDGVRVGLGFSQCRQQEGNQQSDDGYDHQQLDEGKTMPTIMVQNRHVTPTHRCAAYKSG